MAVFRSHPHVKITRIANAKAQSGKCGVQMQQIQRPSAHVIIIVVIILHDHKLL